MGLHFSGLGLEPWLVMLGRNVAAFHRLQVSSPVLLGSLAVVLFFVPVGVSNTVHQQRCPYCTPATGGQHPNVAGPPATSLFSPRP